MLSKIDIEWIKTELEMSIAPVEVMIDNTYEAAKIVNTHYKHWVLDGIVGNNLNVIKVGLSQDGAQYLICEKKGAGMVRIPANILSRV